MIAPSPETEGATRAEVRAQIREFLRYVPREDTHETLTFTLLSGEVRTVTRQQFTERIERMRARQRQVMRLAVEQRIPRVEVTVALHDISMKTLERDEREALDILAEEAGL